MVDVNCLNCATSGDVAALAAQVSAQATVQAQTYYATAHAAQATQDTVHVLVWLIVVLGGVLLCTLVWQLFAPALHGVSRRG